MMNKKILALFCALLFLCTILPSCVQGTNNAQMQLCIGQKSYKANETFTVTLRVKNATFNTIGYAIKYPKDKMTLTALNEQNLSVATGENDKKKGIAKQILYTTGDPVEAKSDGKIIAKLEFTTKESTDADITFTTIKGDVDFSEHSCVIYNSGKSVNCQENVVYAQKSSEKDIKAAQDCDKLIQKIPSKVKQKDEISIYKAMSAYDSLTKAQKQLLKNEGKLLNAKKTLDNLKAADTIQQAIKDLPENITLKDKALYDKAKNAYNALSDKQKKTIPLSLLTKYHNIQNKMEKLLVKVRKVEKNLRALPENIAQTPAYMGVLVSADISYQKLSKEEQQAVDKNLQAKLKTLKEQASTINHENNGLTAKNISYNVHLYATPLNNGEEYNTVKIFQKKLFWEYIR